MQISARFGSLGRRVAVVAVISAIALASFGCGANIDRGKVLFSTDVPTADSKCQPSHQVNSVSAKTSVYAIYVFKDRPGSETVSVTLAKDGANFIGPVALTSNTSGLDCFGDTTDLSTLPGWAAGSYAFTVTSSNGTIATGTLTITP